MLLGCNMLQLAQWLESKFKRGMNWFNYGEWDVDHVLPCASFDLTDEDEQKTCFVHSNLQPLWASENQSEGCRY